MKTKLPKRRIWKEVPLGIMVKSPVLTDWGLFLRKFKIGVFFYGNPVKPRRDGYKEFPSLEGS